MTKNDKLKFLERVVVEYMERYGTTPLAREYFHELYMELVNSQTRRKSDASKPMFNKTHHHDPGRSKTCNIDEETPH